MSQSSHIGTKTPIVKKENISNNHSLSPYEFDDDDVDFPVGVQVVEEKTWKDNIFVPLGLFGGACVLAGMLVYKGRGDGRQLGQRIMEARVMAQATLLAGILGLGVLGFGTSTKQKENQKTTSSS